MNRYRNLTIIVTILVSTFATACTNVEEEASGIPACHMGKKPMAALETPTTSIYNMDSEWTNQNGETVHLIDLRGKVQIMTMMFTNCKYMCPRIVSDMMKIQSTLGSDASKVGFVMFSLDPERDTPERLLEYATQNHLPLNQWTLLTAPEPTTRQMSMLLGVQYQKLTTGDVNHSSVIAVVDSSGTIVTKQLELGQEPSSTVEIIRGLVTRPL